MKKSGFAIVATAALASVLSLSACGGTAAQPSGTDQSTSTQDNTDKKAQSASKGGKISTDDLSNVAGEDVEKTVSALNEECDTLIAEIDSFEAYTANVDKVQAFYDKLVAESNAIGIRMRQYSLGCANYVLDSNLSHGQMYDELEAVYDDIYWDAGDDLYDALYSDMFEKLYDAFYNGVVKDGYDTVGYGEWSEVSSDAYDMYSDAMSDVYDSISDWRSDVYDFSSDTRSKLFGDKMEKAQKEVDDFQDKINKLLEEDK